MKFPIFLLLILTCSAHMSNAQYFEWSTEVPAISNRGNYITDFKVDHNGNSYVIATGQGCQAGCQFCTVSKFNSQGIGGSSNSGFTNWRYTGMAIDRNINIIRLGINFGQTSIQIGGITVPPQTQFLEKTQGAVTKWVKLVSNFPSNFVCDNLGNIYCSDGSKIEKRNSSGNIVWTNTTIGGGIQIDGSNRLVLISNGNLIKLNGNNAIIYSKPLSAVGALAVQKNGDAFILTTDSLIKFNTSGGIVWKKHVAISGALAVDTIGRIIIMNSNAIYRISSSGNTIQWSFPIDSINNTISSFGVSYAGDIYILSQRSSYSQTIICPFSLYVQPMSIGLSQTQIILSKINVNSPIPFQAGIYTDKLPVVGTYGSGNYLCTGKSFSIPYSFCTNSVSNFNPGNQFYAELFGGGISPLNIGNPSNFIIPKTVPEGTTYRIRVSSSSPYVEGYPNLPDYWNSNIRIQPTVATITPSGNTTFCQGNSITLKATTDPFYNYAWIRNDTVIVPQGLDTIITASVNGIYKLVAIDKFCGCTDTASINVTVNNLPSATITASGPLSFCNGDSVILTANSGPGLTYQWKVNNVNIPFAFYQNYKATQAGTYKVKVADSNNCTKVSSGKTVSIVCKEESSLAVKTYSVNNQGTIFNFINNSENEMKLALFNLNGEIAGSMVIVPGGETYSFSMYSSGMYTIRIIDREKVYWEKLLSMR